MTALTSSSVLDLVTGPTSAEGTSFRRTISQVVEDRGTHSLFVVLAPPNSKRLSSISEEASDRDSLSDEDFIRSLLHLTPLKDIHVGLLRPARISLTLQGHRIDVCGRRGMNDWTILRIFTSLAPVRWKRRGTRQEHIVISHVSISQSCRRMALIQGVSQVRTSFHLIASLLTFAVTISINSSTNSSSLGQYNRVRSPAARPLGESWRTLR